MKLRRMTTAQIEAQITRLDSPPDKRTLTTKRKKQRLFCHPQNTSRYFHHLKEELVRRLAAKLARQAV